MEKGICQKKKKDNLREYSHHRGFHPQGATEDLFF